MAPIGEKARGTGLLYKIRKYNALPCLSGKHIADLKYVSGQLAGKFAVFYKRACFPKDFSVRTGDDLHNLDLKSYVPREAVDQICLALMKSGKFGGKYAASRSSGRIRLR